MKVVLSFLWTVFQKAKACWTCFSPLFLCDWFNLPSYRYCSSAGNQRQMETTSVHCTWTSEIKDSIFLKVKLVLSKICNFAKKKKKKSDFLNSPFFFFSQKYFVLKIFKKNMLSGGFYCKEIILLLHNGSHTRSYYIFWELWVSSRIHFLHFLVSREECNVCIHNKSIDAIWLSSLATDS